MNARKNFNQNLIVEAEDFIQEKISDSMDRLGG